MPDRSETAVMVDAAGTRRRLQALCFMGHTQTSLAARLGVPRRRLGQLLRGEPSLVDAGLAGRVRGLYDELWDVVPTGGPAGPARAAARRRGWVSPLAWDDDPDEDAAIDNPDAAPDLGAKPAARPAVVAENLTWLMWCGYTLNQAAARLGVSRGYVLKLEARFPGLTQRGQVAA